MIIHQDRSSSINALKTEEGATVGRYRKAECVSRHTYNRVWRRAEEKLFTKRKLTLESII